MADWRVSAGVTFDCEKGAASGSRGMIVTNHPLGSAAGAQILAEGGNAVDAAVASLLALTVVEPMMIGLVGGGMMHIRRPDGTHLVIDGLSTAPAAARPDMYEPLSEVPPLNMETKGRKNLVGAESVAVPGNLLAWCDALARFGRLSLAEVIEPAIRYAAHGFAITPYLSNCIAESAGDLAEDPGLSALLLPNGRPLAGGDRLVQGDYAESLRTVAREGAAAIHGGALGTAIGDYIAGLGGALCAQDLLDYRLVDRDTVRGTYRDYEIVGPPPPSSAGVHIVQMLNILEGYDVAGAGFGSADNFHLLAEVLKIAFADRAAATADPAYVDVPVGRLISKSYAEDRRAKLDPARAQAWRAGVSAGQSPHTTHVTVADSEGNVVAATHTINSLFGARLMIPGLGIIPNNYMSNFDPNPGRALSIAPCKRITTSQAPMMALRGGRVVYALGLPGGLRIFGGAMQALINLIDHGMSLQEAVEAPRLWTQGLEVEIEDGVPEPVLTKLREMGHRLAVLPHVGGGTNAVEIRPDGSMVGAACWRADGVAIGIGGGHARPGVRFWPNQVRR